MFLKYSCISCKYACNRLSNVMYILSNSEVYLKQAFNIDVFILRLCSILEVDFLNLGISFKTQKYT